MQGESQESQEELFGLGRSRKNKLGREVSTEELRGPVRKPESGEKGEGGCPPPRAPWVPAVMAVPMPCDTNCKMLAPTPSRLVKTNLANCGGDEIFDLWREKRS